jgi:hypothetical protein
MKNSRSLSEDRLAKGLCPRCGADAAPYRLCARCREMDALGRLLNRGVECGYLRAEMEGTRKFYAIADESKRDAWRYTFASDGEKGYDDKRYRPRIGRVPVDVEAELINIFREAGRYLSIEEVMAAWGKLRAGRQRASIARDMAAIVRAQDRRERRASKRVELARRQGLLTE